MMIFFLRPWFAAKLRDCLVKFLALRVTQDELNPTEADTCDVQDLDLHSSVTNEVALEQLNTRRAR